MIGIISFSSIYLDRAANPWIIIGLGAGLLYSFLGKAAGRHRWSVYLQSCLLFLFHWTSQLNWCLVIYIIVLTRLLSMNDGLNKSVLQTLFYMAAYSSIRLSYSEINPYSILVTLSDIISSIIIVTLVWHIKSAEKEREELKRKNEILLRVDPLTGLLNYQAFREKLEELTREGKSFCLIVVDCFNIRILNAQQGYREVNDVLRKMAELLRARFQQAIISRYSGGEFSVAFECDSEQRTPGMIEELFDAGKSDFGSMQLIYGYSCDHGKTIDERINEIENQLFNQKRDFWLKRDEHIFRADKLKVIGELAAGMAHEIRNPLTTIKGFLQLAGQNNYKNMDQFHHIIMSEITRVSELTAEFLQFSKPHFVKLRLESLQSCIQRSVSIMETELSRHGHRLVLEAAEEPLLVEIDRDKIVQVLVNMLKNAIDAMDDEGKIAIRAYAQDRFAVIEFEDTGSGISDENMDKLFEPFFTTKEQGTGLGLSVSHKIIQDHGGSIHVQSAISKGTTFIIRLPLSR